METLLGDDKTAVSSLNLRHVIPFSAFDGIPESVVGEDEAEKPFLETPFNKEQKAFRSPWTNMWYLIEQTSDGEDIRVYEKDLSDTAEQEIRDLEGIANEVWEAYTQLYYGKDSIGSVFLKPRSGDMKGVFEGMFGVMKVTDDHHHRWDSIHYVKVDEPKEADKTCMYHVESSVICSLTPYKKSNISCTMSKETSKELKVRYSSLQGSHLENLGKIIEDVEIEFRSRMERVDMPKAMEVIESIHRKNQGSATAHLFSDAPEATGMGVGAGMIGEIANKAKAKIGQGGTNPFMEAMKANLERKKEDNKQDSDGVGEKYVDLKKTLKKGVNPIAGEAMASLKLKEDETGHQYTDLKAGLKKSKPKAPGPPPEASSPTPEFMDFRNKLKKAGH